MMLWNVSEGPAQDKAGLLSTKGHSEELVVCEREVLKPNQMKRGVYPRSA
jgi:hypothetical protein